MFLMLFILYFKKGKKKLPPADVIPEVSQTLAFIFFTKIIKNWNNFKSTCVSNVYVYAVENISFCFMFQEWNMSPIHINHNALQSKKNKLYLYTTHTACEKKNGHTRTILKSCNPFFSIYQSQEFILSLLTMVYFERPEPLCFIYEIVFFYFWIVGRFLFLLIFFCSLGKGRVFSHIK